MGRNAGQEVQSGGKGRRYPEGRIGRKGRPRNTALTLRYASKATGRELTRRTGERRLTRLFLLTAVITPIVRIISTTLLHLSS